MKNPKNKLKIAVIISVVSVLIAVISLMFSFYIGIKDMEYKEKTREIQLISQELQKNNMQFEEGYKKIELAQQDILDSVAGCSRINSAELDKNSRLLSNSRGALIKNDYLLVANYIDLINIEKICYSEGINNTFYLEAGILGIIWLALIISLFKVRKR